MYFSALPKNLAQSKVEIANFSRYGPIAKIAQIDVKTVLDLCGVPALSCNVHNLLLIVYLLFSYV